MEHKMIRRKIKPDNQCLFTAIGYAMEHKMDMATELRHIAAGIIASNPDKYNSESLTMSNKAYVEYILKPSTWGSANEIDILADYYNVCITVIRISNGDIESFGEEYALRIILLYNETHYDLAVRNSSSGHWYLPLLKQHTKKE